MIAPPMLRRPLLLCVTLQCCLALAAENTVVHSIQFNGNHKFPERQLLQHMVTQPGSLFSAIQLFQDVETLLDLYHQDGYALAEIRVDSQVYSHDSAEVYLMLTIDEGNRLTIRGLAIHGNTMLTSDDILSTFDTRVGNVLTQEILERDIAGLIKRYEENGYPFAKVEVDNLSTVNNGSSTALQVDLLVDEGQKVTIDEIRVAGNKETKTHVIVRETRIKLHDLFNQDKVERIPHRLNRMNIFSRVREPEVYVGSSGGGLMISVQEGRTNTFDGVIGYAPGATNEEGIVTGLIDVSMRNLFGSARKLSVHWLRDERDAQELSLQYLEPWLFDQPINLSGGFAQRQQDTTYVRRSFEVHADLLLTESLSLGGVFTQENIIPSGTYSGALLNSRTMTTGIEVHYDTRDDLLSPTSGVNYRSDYGIGTKKVFGETGSLLNTPKTSTVQKISVNADFFVSLLSRQVAACGIHGRQLTSDRIELGDLYRFGGTRSLRGYRENQFLGSRIAWVNVEYRFLLERRSFFYGFVDNGYYYLPGDDAKGVAATQNYKYGYGVGVQVETSLGNIGVTFALGEGDSFSQAKIHFGLVNDF